MNILISLLFLLIPVSNSKQGVEGSLREIKGNQMGIEKTSSQKGQPLVGAIYLYKNLTNTQLEGLEGQWCKSVQQKPYKIIQTNNKGQFKQALPAGKYFILASAYDGYFIPSFDQQNQPSSILVVSGKYTPVNILVNSKAIY